MCEDTLRVLNILRSAPHISTPWQALIPWHCRAMNEGTGDIKSRDI